MPATSQRQRRPRHRRPVRAVQPSLYPRPQYAAWGMAPAGGLVAPSLDGVATTYAAVTGDGVAVALARTLLGTGIGQPADWSACGRSANAFVHATFARLYAEHGGARISGVFELYGGLAVTPGGYVRQRGVTDALASTTAYLTTFPGSATFVDVGPALDRLERVDARLAATFYSLLLDVLCRVGRPFGYHDAEDHRQMLEDGIDPEDDSEYELPDVAACARPAFTAARYTTPRQIARALRACPDADAVAWIRAALSITAREDTPRPIPPFEDVSEDAEFEEYYDGEPVPFVLLATSEGDAISACFNDNCSAWGETSGLPMFAGRFEVTDHDAVRDAVARYTAWLDTLDRASALLSMLPGNDFTPTPARAVDPDQLLTGTLSREYA